jgi:hypothetical protein
MVFIFLFNAVKKKNDLKMSLNKIRVSAWWV